MQLPWEREMWEAGDEAEGGGGGVVGVQNGTAMGFPYHGADVSVLALLARWAWHALRGSPVSSGDLEAPWTRQRVPWPRWAAQNPQPHVPHPLQPSRPDPTPLCSLPAGQGGRLGQGDPAIPHLLSAQTSPAARGALAPHPLPAKREVGVSAAYPTETPMCGVRGQGRKPRGKGGVQSRE